MYTIIYVLRSPVRGPVYLCLCSVCHLVCDPVVLWSCGPSVPLCLRRPSGHQREPATGACVWSCGLSVPLRQQESVCGPVPVVLWSCGPSVPLSPPALRASERASNRSLCVVLSLWSCGPVVRLYLCVSAGPQDIRESQQQESVCGPVVCLYLCVSRSLCVVLSLWSCGPSVPLCLRRPSGHQREPAAGVCVWSCPCGPVVCLYLCVSRSLCGPVPVVLWSVCTSVSPPALRTSERASSRSRSSSVRRTRWRCRTPRRLTLRSARGRRRRYQTVSDTMTVTSLMLPQNRGLPATTSVSDWRSRRLRVAHLNWPIAAYLSRAQVANRRPAQQGIACLRRCGIDLQQLVVM